MKQKSRKIYLFIFLFAALFLGVSGLVFNSHRVSAQTTSTGCPTTGVIKIVDVRLDDFPTYPNETRPYVETSITQNHLDPRAKGGIAPGDIIVLLIDNPCPGKYYPPQIFDATLLIDGVESQGFDGGVIRGQTDYLDKAQLDTKTTFKYSYVKYRLKATEELVDAITNNKKISIRARALYGLFNAEFDLGNDGLIADKDLNIYRNLCVPIYGTGGKFNVTFMRGKSSNLTPDSLLVDALGTSRDGFATKDPFVKYINQFSFWVDLKKHDDAPWVSAIYNLKFNYQVNNLMSQMASASSCKNGGIKILGADLPPGIKGLSSLSGEGLFVSVGSFIYKDHDVFLHEFGHAFGGLIDEYFGGVEKVSASDVPSLRNCSTYPSASFSYNGILYGGSYPGCNFSGYIQGKNSATPLTIFRSTDKSIMRVDSLGIPLSPYFSTVQCGYILSKIKGNSVKSNFPECSTLQVQK